MSDIRPAGTYRLPRVRNDIKACIRQLTGASTNEDLEGVINALKIAINHIEQVQKDRT